MENTANILAQYHLQPRTTQLVQTGQHGYHLSKTTIEMDTRKKVTKKQTQKRLETPSSFLCTGKHVKIIVCGNHTYTVDGD